MRPNIIIIVLVHLMFGDKEDMPNAATMSSYRNEPLLPVTFTEAYTDSSATSLIYTTRKFFSTASLLTTRVRVLAGFLLLLVVSLIYLPTTSDFSSKSRLSGGTHVLNPCLDSIEFQRDLLLSSYRQSFQNVTHIAFIDFPDHNNAGDAAIGLGELLILEALGIEIRYMCSTWAEFNNTEMDASLADINPENTAIALHGGGNMGNIWRDSQDFRVWVVQDNLGRKIRSFPQTYEFFEPTESEPNPFLAETQSVYSRHPDLELAGRDTESFNQIVAKFPSNHVKLLPDAAVMIGSSPLSLATPRQMRFHEPIGSSKSSVSNFKWPAFDLVPQSPVKDAIILGRNDFEGGQDHRGVNWKSSLHPFDVELVDWSDNFDSSKLWPKPFYSENNDGSFQKYWRDVARLRVEHAMEQLLSGRYVITDRLHAHIMSTLLGIGHIVIEETDLRKVQRVHDTWYSACALPSGIVASDQFRTLPRLSDANTVFVTDLKTGLVSAMSLLTAASNNPEVSYTRVVRQGDSQEYWETDKNIR